jgi:hypothetical protein
VLLTEYSVAGDTWRVISCQRGYTTEVRVPDSAFVAD